MRKFIAVAVGVLAAGIAWGIHLPLLLAGAVGLLAAGAYVVADLAMGRTRSSDPELSASARAWRVRAGAALEQIEELSVGIDGLDTSMVHTQARDVLKAFEKNAANVTRLEAALERINPAGVNADLARLSRDYHSAADPRLRAELERSNASLQDQLAAYERVRATHATEVARMRAGALGLESLAVRLAELSALGPAAGQLDSTVVTLTGVGDSLESLRLGLEEANTTSRRMLGEIQ